MLAASSASPGYYVRACLFVPCSKQRNIIEAKQRAHLECLIIIFIKRKHVFLEDAIVAWDLETVFGIPILGREPGIQGQAMSQ